MCDSEALLQAVRCLGILGCDSVSAAASSSFEIRGLCAIAKRCCKQFAVWGCGESDSVSAAASSSLFGKCWKCDSEALLQAVRCLGMWDAIA